MLLFENRSYLVNYIWAIAMKQFNPLTHRQISSKQGIDLCKECYLIIKSLYWPEFKNSNSQIKIQGSVEHILGQILRWPQRFPVLQFLGAVN